MALQGSEETGLGSVPTAAGSDSPGETPPTGVTQIIPGAGIGVDPPGGTGAVTVSNTAPAPVVPIYTDGIATGAVQLSTLASASYTEGAQAWVKSVGALFVLQQTALTVDNITVVAAVGKAGYQWVRLIQPNAAFWSTTTWHVDPVSGSDEASGTGTGANALKTNAELNRRLYYAQLSVSPTINWDNDIPDADSLTLTCTSTGQLTVQGSQTVVATDTVTAVQARTAASNLANQITTVTNFAAFVGQMLRVQGTTNYAGITKSIAAGTVRLGELWNTTTAAQASSVGVTVGQIVEVVQTRKGPRILAVFERLQITVNDVRFDGALSIQIRAEVPNGGMTFTRCIIGGTGTGNLASINNFLFNGGIFRNAVTCGALSAQGVAFMGNVSFQSPGQSFLSYVKLRSTVWQGATCLLGSMILHVDADFGQFDLTGGIGISINPTGTGEGSFARFSSGRHYGNGNAGGANVWSIGVGNYVAYATATPPTMDAGNGVAINGGNVAVGALPVALSTTTGSAVYAF